MPLTCRPLQSILCVMSRWAGVCVLVFVLEEVGKEQQTGVRCSAGDQGVSNALSPAAVD